MLLPHHRRPHAVAAGWCAWAIVVVLLILVPTACHISQAHAAALYRAAAHDASVVLYDEPCALKDRVTNLPLRATWQDAGSGRRLEGCWGLNGFGIVMMLFEDRSAAGFPALVFHSVAST